MKDQNIKRALKSIGEALLMTDQCVLSDAPIQVTSTTAQATFVNDNAVALDALKQLSQHLALNSRVTNREKKKEYWGTRMITAKEARALDTYYTTHKETDSEKFEREYELLCIDVSNLIILYANIGLNLLGYHVKGYGHGAKKLDITKKLIQSLKLRGFHAELSDYGRFLTISW